MQCNSCSDCNTKIAAASAGETIKLNTSISDYSSTCIDFNGKDNITFNCQGYTIDGNDPTSGAYGIYLDDTGDGSNNNTIRNCTITDFYAGLHILSSDNNLLINNTINSNLFDGVWLWSSNSNTIINSTINSNVYRGLYLYDSENNNITENIFEKNRRDTEVYESSPNNFQDNQFIGNSISNMISISFDNRTPDLSDLVKFNISVYYPNGTACASFTDKTYTRPNETVNSSTSSEKIIGNFTVDENGMYSLVVNITDSNGNRVKRKYTFFVNTTQTRITNYYLRPDVNPTHGQPAGSDAKSLLFDSPSGASSFTCGQWIQASTDNISSTPFGYIKNINISSWYKVSDRVDGEYIGIQRYVFRGYEMDKQEPIPLASQWTWNVSNFTQLNWSIDYEIDWYRFAIKLYGTNPTWYTNQTHPSYVNVSYLYSNKPEIKELTNVDNVTLLSATSPSIEENNATIYLEGTGTTNLTVKMPNTYTYNAYYDGVACGSGDCNLTQFGGELEFQINLGSEHNITINGQNTAPTAIVSIAPSFPNSSNNLTCNATIEDPDSGQTLTAYWNWYKNDVLNITGYYSSSITNNTNTLITTLLSGNTSDGEEWKCEIIPYDGKANGTSVSDSVFIGIHPPQYSNVGDNSSASYPYQNNYVKHYAYWTDETELGYYKFSWNNSGSWSNETYAFLDQTPNVVETGMTVGYYSSIAADSEGVVHISHRNNTGEDLRYCNNTGGTWSCVFVEGSAISAYGQWTSIAVDSNNKIYISHQLDDTMGIGADLKCCNNTRGSWGCVVVVGTGSTRYYGEYTSIAVDKNNKVHIATTNGSGTVNSLLYCTNALGSWACAQPLSNATDVKYISLALDSGNKAHISYFNDTPDDLWYCTNSEGPWSCEAVESSFLVSYGSYSSIAVDSTNKVHISHRYDAITDALRYCNGVIGSWNCSSVETGDLGYYSSIAVGTDDRPHIIHFSTSNQVRYCEYNSSWNCRVLFSNTGEPRTYGRALAVKKGRLVDSTSDIGYGVLSFYNSTNGGLGYYNTQNKTEQWSNVTKQVTASPGSTVSWMIYANDTANDWNQTGQQNYTVKVPCGYYVNSNLNLDQDITGCTGTILYINASYVTLDCQNHYLQTTGNYSINNTGFSNVTVKNCRINGSSSNSHDGILYYQASNGTISNNIITEANYGISLLYSSNNNISDNNATAAYTIYIYSSSNNSILGGSIKNPSGEKESKIYNLFNISSTNSFRNTNFTAKRQIYLNNTNDWFNYNNDTTGGVWLNTSLSVAQPTITRELVNINQTLVQWNDTNTTGTGITATYNVSGLLASTYYNVYNNSVLAYTRQSSSEGWLNFTILLGSEHEIKVEKYPCSLAMGFSTALLNGIQFGSVDPTNQINNATENNFSGVTNYSIQVQIGTGCSPSTGKLWTGVNQSFNTTGGNSIPYTLYFHRYNNTNNTVPGSSQTPYSLDYQLIGDNLQNGDYSYMKFFMNVSTGTVPGTYKSYTFFKLNLTS